MTRSSTAEAAVADVVFGCIPSSSGMTKGGDFIQGHDAKLHSAIVQKAGGIIELRGIVEKALNCRIKVRMD